MERQEVSGEESDNLMSALPAGSIAIPTKTFINIDNFSELFPRVDDENVEPSTADNASSIRATSCSGYDHKQGLVTDVSEWSQRCLECV
eukprot:scaffold179243_cov27-Prasinocladus_malaysianus.AAC.1